MPLNRWTDIVVGCVTLWPDSHPDTHSNHLFFVGSLCVLATVILTIMPDREEKVCKQNN